MKLPLYQVDAFTDQIFKGNPAAVCPLEKWLDDSMMQKIAMENNLSETAFVVPDGDDYQIRWFTPAEEVDLCGHATLATAHVLFSYYHREKCELVFNSKSGPLIVTKTNDGLAMDFPASLPSPSDIPEYLLQASDEVPQSVLAGFDYVIVLANQKQVKEFSPNFIHWQHLDLRGVIVTALGDDCDFVSRCFYPSLDVNEDPVTGSAHCILAPYWAKQLGKEQLNARQLSARGGLIKCNVDGDRVMLYGQCAEYLKGEITVA